MQLTIQRIVQFPRLVRDRPFVRILDFGVRVFQHVAQTGARPRTEAQKSMIQKAQRIQPQHGRIDPTIYRNVR